MSDLQGLLTTGDLCRECKTTRARLEWALDSYNIEPRQRAGILRLYGRDQLPEILSALRRIASNRRVIGA